MSDSPRARDYIRAVASANGSSDDTAADTPAKQPAFTDLGNAERFRNLYGRDFRYCFDLDKDGKWICWDQHRWTTDMSGAAKRAGYATVETIPAEMTVNGGEQGKHYVASQSAAAITNMLALAKALRPFPCLTTDFDQDPQLLGVQNGIIDFSREGILRPAQREDMMMSQCAVPYDADAKCERWEKVISDSMGGDKELIAFCQRMYGLFLTGDVSDRAFFVFLGVARGGKGTQLSTFMAMMGHDYAKILPAACLLKAKFNNPGGPSPDVALTRGARLIVASEPDARGQFDEGKIKDWTSGDGEVAGRGMRENFSTTNAWFKLVVQANDLPSIREASEAMSDRLKVIRFDHRVADGDVNKDLKRELREYELPGILAWAVEGWRQWKEQGLNPPAGVVKATKDTLAAQSLVNLFLSDSEWCHVTPLATEIQKDLYDGYRRWAEATGNYAKMKKQDFKRELLARGDITEGKSDRTYTFKGLELLSPTYAGRAPSEEKVKADSDAAANDPLFKV